MRTINFTRVLVLFFFSANLMFAQNYTVDTQHRHQVIDNFGASDAWTAQFFGQWPDSKRNDMADLLFSLEKDAQGKPKGIGLSIWRFNIGAGSAEQGDSSYIPDITRRAECFQLPNGSYDWSKQAGQRWFLKAAKERGVKQFLAFNISPPIHMTRNGLAGNKFGTNDGTLNIKTDKYNHFADFLATVVDELGKREGINFQYLSPFNEPEWNWDAISQEGTPALNSEIAKTVRLLDKKFSEKNLQTQILVSESGQYDYLYKKNTNLPGRDNQIASYFDANSKDFIGDLKHVPHLVVGHSYWTTQNDVLFEKRNELRKELDKYKLNFWQTELCIMGNDKEVGGGEKKDLSMKTALYVARVIHHDLCIANASAWQWWLAMSNSDYKDGLIYASPNADLTDGTFTDSKLLWALGNYSRFIRPGSFRVDVASSVNVNDSQGLMVSSYINEADRELISVVVNYAQDAKDMHLEVKGIKVKEMQAYITSDVEGQNLMPQKIDSRTKIQVPPKSIITLVAKY